MKTTDEPTTAYIDAAIERIEAGVTRQIRARRRTIGTAFASVAAVAVVAFWGITNIHTGVTSEPQALGTKPLTAADVASWTSAPKPVSGKSTVIAACQAHLANEPGAGGPASVINSDARGRVQSAIVANGGYSGYCIGTPNSEAVFVVLGVPDAENNTHYTPPAVAPDAINLGPSGSYTGTSGWTFAEGAVGSDVVGVTLHEDGTDVKATIENGTWMAWWPLHFRTPDDAVGGTITITSADGTTTTVTPAQIQLN